MKTSERTNESRLGRIIDPVRQCSSGGGQHHARGVAHIEPLPPDEQPLSEQFRIVAKQWVQSDGAARLLEESKTASLSQMMKKLGDVPAAHAERDVKASKEWDEYIQKMVNTRTEANLKKVHMEFLRMKFAEWQSAEANVRSERRL